MTWLVGACRAAVPVSGVRMSGFAARTARSVGVADALEARALAVAAEGGEPTVLVTLDAIGVDRRFAATLRGRLSGVVPPGRVMVTATHTHGGPALLGGAYLGEVEEGVLRSCLEAAEAAARGALEQMQGAELRSGRVRVPGIAHNRRQPGGPVDDELSVLWAVGEGGRVIAALLSFALHPVVLGPDNLLLTRDYVGYALDAVEAQHPGSTALFATGCAGQVNHGHPATASFSGAAAPNRTFAVARSIGERLAGAGLEVMQRGGRLVAASELRVARRPVRLPYMRAALGGPAAGAATPRLLAELQAAEREAASMGDEASRLLLAPQLEWAWRHLNRAPASRLAEVSAIGLGGLALVLLPGEPFVEYGLALKALAASRHPSVHVIPVGYANDAPGYLPTAAAIAEGGYEVELAYRFYGLPARYGAGVEGRLLRTAEAVLEEVLG